MAASLQRFSRTKEELMRLAIATVTVMISATWASAQAGATQDPAAPAKTVTVIGCVAGSAGAGPFTLANTAIVPESAKDSGDPDAPSPVPSPASSSPTQPAGSGSSATAATGT